VVVDVRPDPAQATVVEHARGPLLVTGPSGSGKTWALRERFARLIEDGADPERVALVVGSKRARREARRALLRRVRTSLPALRVVTLHGLAFHVVGQRYRALGYERPPDVLSAADQFAKVRELLEGEDPGQWPAYGQMLGMRGFADQVRQFLTRAQEALLSPDELMARSEAAGLTGWRELGAFYRRYLQVLDDEGAVDFAGLVEQAAASPEPAGRLFDHLLVDDYQDSTFAAERLLIDLEAESLVVAGDPEAHVFSFQGATDEPIRRFGDVHPRAVRVELEANHRSGEGTALRAWFSPHTSEEHGAVARELRRIHVQEGVAWRDIAVIVRRQGGDLEGLLRALDDAGIPRVTPERGLSLLVEPATGPYLLALRWLARPEERDGLVEGVLTSQLAGLSPASARGLLRAAAAAGEPRAAALLHDDGLSPEELQSLEGLRGVLSEVEGAGGPRGRSAMDAFSVLWRRLHYSRRLVEAAEPELAEDAVAYRRDLDAALALSEAISAFSEGGDGSVAAFLDLVEAGREGPGFAEPGDERLPDAVRVYTAHGVAGQEFDTVAVVGAVEGTFPSLSRAEPMFDLATLERPVSQSERNRLRLRDERRLFRMVLGRARRHVLITASEPHGTDLRTSSRSRFVEEAGATWEPAPAGPYEEPLSTEEARAAWRRLLGDVRAAPGERLAVLDGLLALDADPSAWWYQRDWTGTDRPLHEGVRVSHSKLEKLENCALQFVLGQELGLEGRAGYHAWVGSLVHRLIEECETGALPRSEAALVAEAERRWRQQEFPSFAVSEAFRRLVTRTMLPAWFREYGAAPAVARELRFQFEFEGATVSGVIDRISAVQGGGSQITDYKTGKSRNALKATENLQLGIYYLAVNMAEELAGFRPVRGIELAFLRDSHYDQIARAFRGFTGESEQEFQDQMTAKLGELIHRLGELQAGESYPPNPAANCRYCEFKPLCPLWPEGKDLFPLAEAVEA
jgi:superfamily I DNA/RNA helicase/RecB family exonuclease